MMSLPCQPGWSAPIARVAEEGYEIVALAIHCGRTETSRVTGETL